MLMSMCIPEFVRGGGDVSYVGQMLVSKQVTMTEHDKASLCAYRRVGGGNQKGRTGVVFEPTKCRSPNE